MLIVFAFLLNSLMNFAIGLLVAKFLGPEEYGRYALAFLAASMLQWFLFEWIRASAVRFYTETNRTTHPEIRATLDAWFLTVMVIVGAAAIVIDVLDIDLGLSNQLIAAAMAVTIANAVYDFSSSLLRARFRDRAYTILVVVKNALSFAFVVGGAWYFGSARMALLGVLLSVTGVVALNARILIDQDAKLSKAQWGLTRQFLAYAWPICLGSLIYQSIPMLDRALAAKWHGLAEAGQFALAFDIAIRVLNAIGSSLDAFLFQIAVRADHEKGPEGARLQLADNMAIITAVLVPACIGCLLVLPSFEEIFVPASFHGHFARYFTVLTPALTIAALTSFAVNPIFQIAQRTSPLMIGGLVAAAANVIAVHVLPATDDAGHLAMAQLVGMVAGFFAVVIYGVFHGALWPSLRTLSGILLATAAMAVAVWPLHAMTPGPVALAVQAFVGMCVYGGLVAVLDLAGLRSLAMARLKARRAGAA